MLTAIDPLDENIVATGLVKPRSSIAATHIAQPTTMYGLRRPKRDFELSARTPREGRLESIHYRVDGDIPIRGWTTSPEIGPARKTMATAALERPRDNRYGVPLRRRESRARIER